jgi:hypothetical protein
MLSVPDRRRHLPAVVCVHQMHGGQPTAPLLQTLQQTLNRLAMRVELDLFGCAPRAEGKRDKVQDRVSTWSPGRRERAVRDTTGARAHGRGR